LNPVILPCGHNVCEEHVNQKLKENNSKIYKCDICFEEHEVPKKGFIINLPFIEMMNDNLHLSQENKQKKTLIKDLNNVKKDIDSITKDPEGFIYSYLAKEINKIDLKRETLIEKINKISEEMIQQIKQMETDFKLNLDEKKNDMELIVFDYEQLEEKILKLGEEVRDPTALNLYSAFELNDDLLRENKNKSYGIASQKNISVGKWTNWYRNATNEHGEKIGSHEVTTLRLSVKDNRKGV
jgi:hypothetical protein